MIRWLLRALAPLADLIAGIHLRIGEPKLRGGDYTTALYLLRPGDVILSKEAWRPTNLLIPGKLKHAGVFVGNHGGESDAIAEATHPEARMTNLVSVWQMASRVVILRPRFVRAEGAYDAARRALSYIGTPYDVMFAHGEEAMYCSELVDAAYGGALKVLRRDVLGFEQVIVPDDLRKDERLFRVVWDSDDAG